MVRRKLNEDKTEKSTGMGLYIVNNLIKKLGHKLLIESEENAFTKVSIIFNNNDYYKM